MQIRRLLKQLEKARLEKHISETFILILMGSGTKSHGKNSISWKILIKSIIAKIIMTSVSIDKVLNVENVTKKK